MHARAVRNVWEGGVHMTERAPQEGDKRVIRSKIAEVFAAGDAEQARRRFDKEVRGRAPGWWGGAGAGWVGSGGPC